MARRVSKRKRKRSDSSSASSESLDTSGVLDMSDIPQLDGAPMTPALPSPAHQLVNDLVISS